MPAVGNDKPAPPSHSPFYPIFLPNQRQARQIPPPCTSLILPCMSDFLMGKQLGLRCLSYYTWQRPCLCPCSTVKILLHTFKDSCVFSDPSSTSGCPCSHLADSIHEGATPHHTHHPIPTTPHEREKDHTGVSPICMLHPDPTTNPERQSSSCHTVNFIVIAQIEKLRS